MTLPMAAHDILGFQRKQPTGRTVGSLQVEMDRWYRPTGIERYACTGGGQKFWPFLAL